MKRKQTHKEVFPPPNHKMIEDNPPEYTPVAKKEEIEESPVATRQPVAHLETFDPKIAKITCYFIGILFIVGFIGLFYLPKPADYERCECSVPGTPVKAKYAYDKLNKRLETSLFVDEVRFEFLLSEDMRLRDPLDCRVTPDFFHKKTNTRALLENVIIKPTIPQIYWTISLERYFEAVNILQNILDDNTLDERNRRYITKRAEILKKEYDRRKGSTVFVDEHGSFYKRVYRDRNESEWLLTTLEISSVFLVVWRLALTVDNISIFAMVLRAIVSFYKIMEEDHFLGTLLCFHVMAEGFFFIIWAHEKGKPYYDQWMAGGRTVQQHMQEDAAADREKQE